MLLVRARCWHCNIYNCVYITRWELPQRVRGWGHPIWAGTPLSSMRTSRGSAPRGIGGGWGGTPRAVSEGGGAAGQLTWTIALGPFFAKAVDAMVDYGQSYGPHPMQEPRNTPKTLPFWSPPCRTGGAFPYCPTFGLPPSRLAAAIRELTDYRLLRKILRADC